MSVTSKPQSHDKPMAYRPTTFLRFNHREIAVVFSLFVFTALLMFTVGVLVGKGLSQPRVEWRSDRNGDVPGVIAEAPPPIDGDAVANELENAVAETDAEPANAPALAQPILIAPSPAPAHEVTKPKSELHGFKSWFKPSAIANLPKHTQDGRFTVQVGSYANREDAEERVAGLKKLGFTGSYITSKEIGEKRETWYRVWLGNYLDLESAQKSGQALQDRGEVRNYLVRKTTSVD